MKSFVSMPEVEVFLSGFIPRNMNKGSYTLDRMHKLMEYLGNPQEQYRSIHIAGTSGKTSTAYFVRALLEQAGKKTGLTVSPHIVAINERIQIHGDPLSDTKFLSYFNEFVKMIEKSKLEPTYFELLIAFAYWVFAKEKVDYAVIETGMGGLLDGTNVIKRKDKICVITNIGFDHTHILGGTIPEIAAQKAGIINAGNHVLAIQQDKDVIGLIKKFAIDHGATLQVVDSQRHSSTIPEFQNDNWNLARAAVNYVLARDNLGTLSREQINVAKKQQPPARMEIFEVGKKTFIIDGAHNGQKVQALAKAIQIKYPNTKFLVVFNMIKTPNNKLRECLEALLPITKQFVFTEFSVSQDYDKRSYGADLAENIVKELGHKNAVKCSNPRDAYRYILSTKETHCLVTGSLYLASQVRSLIVMPKQQAHQAQG